MTELVANDSRPDPFALTADPSSYVPRLALEGALAELAEVVGKTPACAALTGEPGLGKTLLLAVLRERLAGAFECLYVPLPRLSAPELWRWAAVALGLGAGEDDRGAALGRARRLHEEGSGLVLLVDDAGALPPSTRMDLVAALDTRGFSLVLAFSSDEAPQLSALPAHVRRVELGPPMTLSETRAYVHARLRRADPEGNAAARLSADRLAALHEVSGGVPARLHPLLDAWLRAQGDAAFAPSVPGAAPAAAAAKEWSLALPERLRAGVELLRRPRVRVTLIALFVALTLASWLLAWQRSPGITSVGVPVLRVESAAPASAPLAPAREVEAPAAVAAEPPASESLEPAADPPELLDGAPAPVEQAEPAPPALTPARETAPTAARQTYRAPAAAPARGQTNSLARALPRLPPLPDPNRPEPPVHVSTPRFTDEHSPPLLEAEPLAAPPSGPRLSVNARPWAEISLDGRPVGQTPIGELRVTPGAHVVSAKLPDGRVVERSVQMGAGDVYLVFP